MLNVDYFKSYNDFYGHQGGDECLAKIAQAVQNSVSRPADLVARYGWKKFVITLPETDLTGAIAIAEMVHGAIAALAIPHQSFEAGHPVSIGIGCLIPTQDVLPEHLINCGDQAL